MQDYYAQTDFSFGEVSSKFFLQTDFAPRASGVLKAKNIMPYISGGVFKRFGLSTLGSLVFAETLDLTKAKICSYEADDTCFMLVLTKNNLIAYDVTNISANTATNTVIKKDIKWQLMDLSAGKASEKTDPLYYPKQDIVFEQIASEIDFAQCGKELILTHKTFKPKLITYSETKKEFTFGDFKIAACGYWNKELPNDEIMIKVVPSPVPGSQNFSIEVITKGAVENLKKVLINASLCERNGSGRCFIRSFSSSSKVADDTVYAFDVMIIKEFAEQTTKGFISQEYYILKKPMWGESNPATVTFHESRLIFGGYEDDRVVLYFSKINDFHNFGEGQGRADDAFIGGIASGERQKIVGIVSGASLQIFTNKCVYFALHGGVQPITAETITIAKQIHQGSKNLFDSLLNDETVFVGADECNLYSLQRINVNNYTALNLSLATSGLIKNPVSIGCSKFINTGCGTSLGSEKNFGKSESNCDKKYRYLFVVNGDGSLAVCQILAEEAKIAWSSVATQNGNFKFVFCNQEKVLFIVERGGRNFIETLDACLLEDNVQTYTTLGTAAQGSYINTKYPIDIELELFPLLSLKKVSFLTPQLLFHKQVINEMYVYFEGDYNFKVNGQSLNQNEIYAITGNAKIGRVIIGGQWNYGQTIKITYSGAEDLKIYGVVALVKRG